MSNKVLLGIDPGRSKTGLALVDSDGNVIAYAVVLMNNFLEEFQEFIYGHNIEQCIMGNGTTSETMEKTLKKLLTLPISIVDEAHSTEEARKLYWQLHPPKGLRKLLPTSMQVPPENLDGLAAVVLVKRYLKLLKE